MRELNIRVSSILFIFNCGFSEKLVSYDCGNCRSFAENVYISAH